MMTLEELEKKLTVLDDFRSELKTQIAELKAQKEEKPTPPHPRWKPKRDEPYYTINVGCACAGLNTWESDHLDGDIYSLGFVFKTEAETEFAIERLKVLAEMREWAGHNDDGAYIYYHKPSDKILVGWSDYSTCCFEGIHFKCLDDAENCIKAVGKDRLIKYYFGVRD